MTHQRPLRTPLRTLLSVALLPAALVAGACVNTPTETSTTGPGTNPTASPQVRPGENTKSTAPAAAQPSISLEARPHTSDMREVALSPDGASALTLDRQGGVRLWPAFHDGAIPWELPVEEPLWMSVASDARGFVVAFIDTTGAAHVARVEFSGGAARWITAFDAPPMDPMFEVHVLGGGEQILALGVDHRVRLWNTKGQTVAELDERGVVPWQLRVEHDADGKPHAAVVQFAPVRIQQLGLSEAGLALVGDAYPLAIDQSPNRNDIAMSPDGRYATAMQKPTAGKPRFEVEVVNLHDGSRRMLVAESDTGFRPRIHPMVDEVLAETGSGSALRLPLDGAVAWQPGADRTVLTPQPADSVRLDGSTDVSMMHATIRGGVHAVAWDRTLYAQSTDGQQRDVIAHERFHPTAVGLSPTGTTVAWADAAGILVESVSSDVPLRTLAPTADKANLVAFVGDEQIVTMDAKGRVELRELETDTVLDTAALSVGWEIQQTGWRPTPTGGHVILASTQPSAPLQVLSVETGALGSVTEIERSKREAWPEGGRPPRAQSEPWMTAQGLDLSTLGLNPTSIVTALPGRQSDRTLVVQPGALTMIDAAKNKRLWARASWIDNAAWSSDGRHVAFADASGGYVCDAASGAIVFERRTAPRRASATRSSAALTESTARSFGAVPNAVER